MTRVILLVEDEPAVRLLLRRTLEQHGYKVYSAEDGAEALAIYEALDGCVDLVLSDLIMPRVGGRELCRRLRERGATVPFAYMTGWAVDVEKSSVGNEAILLKPFRPQDLLDHVATAMG